MGLGQAEWGDGECCGSLRDMRGRRCGAWRQGWCGWCGGARMWLGWCMVWVCVCGVVRTCVGRCACEVCEMQRCGVEADDVCGWGVGCVCLVCVRR